MGHYVQKTALLVVGSSDDEPTLKPGDAAIRDRLEELGLSVVVQRAKNVTDGDIEGHSLVYVSWLAGSQGINTDLSEKEVPVIAADGETLGALGMIGRERNGYGRKRAGNWSLRFRIVCHSMTAGLNGLVASESLVTSPAAPAQPARILWGRPRANAMKIATIQSDGGDEGALRSPLFAYERNSALNECLAPARRIGFFVGHDTAMRLTPDGWALFDAVVLWAVGEELKQFAEVFREEWREIRERRMRQRIDTLRSATSLTSPPENLVGLALSGGGIRSATFSLGLLQGLYRNRLLRLFDYVSTVSGGGYFGGWWSAWLARDGLNEQDKPAYPLFNPTEIRRLNCLCDRLNNKRQTPNRRVAQQPQPPQGVAERRKKERRKVPAGPNSLPNPISLHFLDNESQACSDLRRAHDDGVANDDKLTVELVKELNKLVEGECLYSVIRRHLPDREERKNFAKSKLTSETLKAIRKFRHRPVGSIELKRLNRLIVEDVYAAEIGCAYFPPQEKIEPERDEYYFRTSIQGARRQNGGDASAGVSTHGRRKIAEERSETRDLLCAGHDPVHHLRLFANYLTPRKGLLSADTWRAILVVSRNMVMTWLILLPIIIAAVLVGQLYFVAANGQIPLGVVSFDTPEGRSTVMASAAAVMRIGSPEHAFTHPYTEEIALANQHIAALQGQIDELRKQSGGTEDAAKKAEAAARADTLAQRLKDEEKRLALLQSIHSQVLAERLWLAAWPLLAIAGWLVLMVSVWMLLNNSGSRFFGWMGAGVLWMLIFFVVSIFYWPIWKWLKGEATFRQVLPLKGWQFGLVFVWAIVAALLWKYAWRGTPKRDADLAARLDPETSRRVRKEVQRNQTLRVQASLLVLLVIAAAVLALAGFGHEIIEHMRFLQRDEWQATVARWVGYVTGVLSIAGAIFTAIKASPAGGGDERELNHDSFVSRLIFSLTPPLVLVALAVCAAWASHQTLYYVTEHAANGDAPYKLRLPPVTCAMLTSIILCLSFAVSEIKWRGYRIGLWLAASFVPAIALGVLYALDVKYYGLLVHYKLRYAPPLLLLAFSLSLTLLRVGVREVTGERDGGLRAFSVMRGRHWLGNRTFTRRGLLIAWLLIALLAVAGEIIITRYGASLFNYATLYGTTALLDNAGRRTAMPSTALGGLSVCLLIAFFEVVWGVGNHRRSLWMLAFANVALGVLLVISFFPDDYSGHPRMLLIHAGVGLLAATLGWVVALGWLADPNALSMHLFYRSRLVRAYLGASNKRRARYEVTQAAEGDDMPLWFLKNCQRGAPYHLVNTTLNLAAGRDLTTAQRSSAMFVLSKLNCGSSRTGYRRTDQYMRGRLSLGTAVAVSGAAASPNMGSRTPSSSLAMLMTLLNVRLGYWTPTPNKEHWQSPQAQLWPFYVLREFTSQTSDLSSYCYLTDGGHFDNTGLYSLVERGCRYIVAVDCGADPTPCFSDLGDAIRRCRIDFGAEIKLDIAPFLKEDKKPATQHFIVGEIVYRSDHLRRLGWEETDYNTREKRTGKIILIKPALTNSDETADVRQYGIENSSFPQQGTADQWFDESQFESYRRFGMLCANAAFGRVDALKELRPDGDEVARAIVPFDAKKIRDVFNETYEKFRPKEFDSTVHKELWKIVEEELKRSSFPKMTPPCRYYLEEYVHNGASKLRAMDDFSSHVKAAKENLRCFMGEMFRQQETAVRRNGRKPDEAPLLSEAAFIAARDKSLYFPFGEASEPSSDQNGNGTNGANGSGPPALARHVAPDAGRGRDRRTRKERERLS